MQLTVIPCVYVVHTLCVNVESCVIPVLACVPMSMQGVQTALSLPVSLLALSPSRVLLQRNSGVGISSFLPALMTCQP